MLPVTALFASVFTFFFIRLAFNVIKHRRINRVALGTGGFDDLESAIRAHGNFAEYVPLGLILLGLLEANGGHPGLIGALGLTLLIGRLFHAQGLQTGSLQKRVRGMKLTFGTLTTLAIANIVYALIRWIS
jgi:uncharacterized membrane protein YecN with MAPEG domain